MDIYLCKPIIYLSNSTFADDFLLSVILVYTRKESTTTVKGTVIIDDACFCIMLAFIK